MKQRFIQKKFRAKRLAVIQIADQIVSEYQAQGYRLTLRQLFYQFVSRNLTPNTERAYKNLGDAVSDGRLAGLLDWDAIEDRVRVPDRPLEFRNLDHLVETSIADYRLPRWQDQKYYVELWVEKDALAGVLAPLANEYHVTLMVNRGYSSTSSMYDAAQRFRMKGGHRRAAAARHQNVLLYLGDHDPSGEDMVRDIRDRLDRFGVDVDVQKIALTMEQVRQYNPPPNPAKMSDSRAAGYVAQHGVHSWEVDALPPDVLVRIIRQSIEKYRNKKLMKRWLDQEERDKERLRTVVIVG